MSGNVIKWMNTVTKIKTLFESLPKIFIRPLYWDSFNLSRCLHKNGINWKIITHKQWGGERSQSITVIRGPNAPLPPPIGINVRNAWKNEHSRGARQNEYFVSFKKPIYHNACNALLTAATLLKPRFFRGVFCTFYRSGSIGVLVLLRDLI